MDVQARYYNRILEKKLADVTLREMNTKAFADSMKMMAKDFKKTQGESQKMIDELKNDILLMKMHMET